MSVLQAMQLLTLLATLVERATRAEQETITVEGLGSEHRQALARLQQALQDEQP